jgi:ATP-dependent DNA helicase RecG
VYRSTDTLQTVRGVGPQLAATLADQDIHTIQDLLLQLPLRYEDRSHIVTIAAAPVGEPVTLSATVSKVSHFYRGRRSILQAVITDETGSLTCYWFNASYLKSKLQIGSSFFFAGTLNIQAKTGKKLLTQAAVEALSADTIHTGRIVPLYSQALSLKQGSVRRILKEIVDHLAPWNSVTVASTTSTITETWSDLAEVFKTLHFPEEETAVIAARERLALEELLSVIAKATVLKQHWNQQNKALPIKPSDTQPLVPPSVPFALTGDQQTALTEISTDLKNRQPMNRLLFGDVGSGKTIVAGVAAYWTVQSGFSAALVAPTQILAEQHYQTLSRCFPDLPIQLMTGSAKSKTVTNKTDFSQPKLYLGTHAVLNQLEKIQPALLVYDEQHRFGVKHRSPGWGEPLTIGSIQPHVLTMSATPIPRTLMLSLFAHLSLSTLTESPHIKQPTKTWLVPAHKQPEAWEWIKTQLTTGETPEQGIVVCPFINPSAKENLENVAAATETFAELKQLYGSDPNFKLALLHGGLKPAEKTTVMADVFAQKTQLLVTTPIVEVGVDLPAAKVIVITAAERFGLASLHQLRGRVGRAGQKSFCLLFTTSKNSTATERLNLFCQEHNGLKLAEIDLQRRGAGDLFGTAQHGFDDLTFASWTNVELITTARKTYQRIQAGELAWQPLFVPKAQIPHVAAN